MSAPVLNKVSGSQIDPTAVERSKPLQLAGPPLSGMALGLALVASFLIHGALLGTMLVAEPRQNPDEKEETVTVDLVPENAPEPEKPAPPPIEAKPEPKPEPVPEPKKPAPRMELPDFKQMMETHQALQNQPKAAPAPAQQQAQPQPSGPAATDPAASKDPSENGAAEQGPVLETSPQDAQAAAARISDTMHLPELAALGVFGGAPSNVKAKLSTDEFAAFRAELRRCWTVPTGIPAGQNPRATIRIALKRDGSLDAQPQLLAMSSASHGLPVFRNAMEALTKCQPFHSLPANKYAEWKLLDVQFTARDVGGVAPISGAKTPPTP